MVIYESQDTIKNMVTNKIKGTTFFYICDEAKYIKLGIFRINKEMEKLGKRSFLIIT